MCREPLEFQNTQLFHEIHLIRLRLRNINQSYPVFTIKHSASKIGETELIIITPAQSPGQPNNVYAFSVFPFILGHCLAK